MRRALVLFSILSIVGAGHGVTAQEGAGPLPGEDPLIAALSEAIESGRYLRQLQALDRCVAKWGTGVPAQATHVLLRARSAGSVSVVRSTALRLLGDVREPPGDLVSILRGVSSGSSAHPEDAFEDEARRAWERLLHRSNLSQFQERLSAPDEAVRVRAAADIVEVCPERSDLLPILRTGFASRIPGIAEDAARGIWLLAVQGGLASLPDADYRMLGEDLERLAEGILRGVEPIRIEETSHAHKAMVAAVAEVRSGKGTAARARGWVRHDWKRREIDPADLGSTDPVRRDDAVRQYRGVEQPEPARSGKEIVERLGALRGGSSEGLLVALSSLGPAARDAGVALMPLLRGIPGNLAAETMEALGLDPGAAHAVESLRRVIVEFRAAQDVRVAEEAVVAAGPGAVPFLLSLWIGTDQRLTWEASRFRVPESRGRLRQHAANVLGEMGEGARDALPTLKESADDWRDSGVATMAREAIRRITGADPPEPTPHCEPFFAARVAAQQAGPKSLSKEGGGKETQAGVDAALDWLVRHQSAEGFWDCDGFEARCVEIKCGGAGGPLYDPGCTGLALLALLGSGETLRGPKFGDSIRRGLAYLLSLQDDEGCVGSRIHGKFVYNHAIALLCLAEGYGMTGSALLRRPAQGAVEFSQACRNPYLAWRYGVRPKDNDTSITAWMVLALQSAKSAGLVVDKDAFEGALAWFDRATEPEYGRVGYTARGNGPSREYGGGERFPRERSESTTAMAIFSRLILGVDRKDKAVKCGADLLLKCLPVWDETSGAIDFCYWHYGTLAMFQVGGEHWKKWNPAMKGALLGGQRKAEGDCRRGSWDPQQDPWGNDGGRVYSTAMNCLTLETYYLYPRAIGTK